MQDDRSRLAVELDAAVDRSRALESANSEAASGSLTPRRRSNAFSAVWRRTRTLKAGTPMDKAPAMSQVSVTIDGRKYRLACNEGEERGWNRSPA